MNFLGHPSRGAHYSTSIEWLVFSPHDFVFASSLGESKVDSVGWRDIGWGCKAEVILFWVVVSFPQVGMNIKSICPQIPHGEWDSLMTVSAFGQSLHFDCGMWCQMAELKPFLGLQMVEPSFWLHFQGENVMTMPEGAWFGFSGICVQSINHDTRIARMVSDEKSSIWSISEMVFPSTWFTVFRELMEDGSELVFGFIIRNVYMYSRPLQLTMMRRSWKCGSWEWKLSCAYPQLPRVIFMVRRMLASCVELRVMDGWMFVGLNPTFSWRCRHHANLRAWAERPKVLKATMDWCWHMPYKRWS